jgi:hypothetical protein
MNREYNLGNALFTQAEDGISITGNLRAKQHRPGYDLDLLYVECRFCSKPLLWEQGKTSLLLHASGIDTTLLDAECMILSEGCPNCQPNTPSFQLHVVRVAAFSAQDLMLLHDNKGSA